MPDGNAMPDIDKPDSRESVIPCAGVICFHGASVLLIKRGKAPRAGEWSIPGGRIEPGETPQGAALRELLEETGITARLGPALPIIKAAFEGQTYALHNFAARYECGDVRPGDDAAQARFVSPDELAHIPLWHKTRQSIAAARHILVAAHNAGQSDAGNSGR